jgi:membrane fusion protein (multidrug efflux system)
VIVVPQRAVTELQGTYHVTVVDGQNRAVMRAVTAGDRIGSDWVGSGWAETRQIVR